MLSTVDNPCRDGAIGASARARRRIVLTGQIAAGATSVQAHPADAEGQTGTGDVLSLVLHSLDADGAQDVVDIDLAGKSDMADHMVVASGRSSRHVSAVAEKLIDKLKAEAGIRAKTEGRDSADWVLIDAGDVIVHLFRPEVRDYYQIEKMWMTAPDALARQA
ncbi:MAG: ribosome silencing factor [Pseudomonadota bacterium]